MSRGSETTHIEDDNHHITDTTVEEPNINSRTPLLKTSTLRHSSISHAISLLFQNWWLWEFFGASIAVISIVVIFVILLLYDSSSLPDWPFIFTINSVISFFGTIAKLSLGSIVGAAISQSKWFWFRQGQPRHLQDLQLFDDASRGPIGAAQLMINLRFRQQAALGSALVILMLLFDPFLQQVVAFPSRFVPAKEGSTIFRAQRYVARNEKGLPLPSVVDLSMKSAIYNGIFDEQQKAEFDITHSCPSGNCTWPTFSSLAICNKCVDISSHIRRTCNETGCHQLSLPEGPSLSYSAGQINSSVTNISSSLGGIYASVVRFSSLIIRNINESDNILAVECSLWYCVQSYHTSVELGKLSQKVQSSWRNDSARLSDPSDLLYNPPESIINPSLDPTSYRVSSLAARALNSFTSEMVTGSGGLHKSGPAFSSDIIQALYRADSLATRIANLATSMTNDIRSQSNDSCGSVSGTAWVPESYVQVRWWWFSYPLIIATLSLIFLISSVIETARCKLMVWKSNNLIILFLGRKLVLDQTLRELSSNELSEVNEQIQDIKTQLSQTDDRTWQLT